MTLKRVRLSVIVFSLALICCSSLYAKDKKKDQKSDEKASTVSNIINRSKGPVSALAWSPDSQYFATGGNDFVILWVASSNETNKVFKHIKANSKVIQFSRDGKVIFYIGVDNSIVVADVNDIEVPVIFPPIPGIRLEDAVFTSADGFSLAAQTDINVLSGYFRLVTTGNFVQKKIMDINSDIFALDSNNSCTSLLVALKNGKALVRDMNSDIIIAESSIYTDSNIKPRFSPTSKEWISAYGPKTLALTYTDQNSFRLMEAEKELVNAAVFDATGKNVAAATNAASILVFNTETFKVEKEFELEDPEDQVLSIAYSPDGEFLLAGTQKGCVYRWSLTGKVFDPVLKRYVIGGKGIFRDGGYDLSWESIDFSVGYSTLPDYYLGSFNFAADYRIYPNDYLYYLVDCGFGMGFPDHSFPYDYTIDGKKQKLPVLYTLFSSAGAGVSGYFFNTDVIMFCELSGGYNIRSLSNNELDSLIVTKPVFGFYGTVSAGVLVQNMRLSCGYDFDSNFDRQFKVAIGVCQRFRPRGGLD